MGMQNSNLANVSTQGQLLPCKISVPSCLKGLTNLRWIACHFAPLGDRKDPSAMQWTRGTLFDRRVHRDYRGARSRRPLTRCFDGKGIASLKSSLRRIFES
jgi:hypothetical protein